MRIPYKKILRRTSRILLRLGILVLLATILLEVLYRYQVVDTYRREWNFLNPDQENDQAGKGTSVLVMGDSFTAAPGNWVDSLRHRRPDLTLYNSAVPGTGIRQANFMASRRFDAVQPQHFIYQIYVGNDLFDLRYPLNWDEIGLTRNLYWMLANRLRSLGWLNYALGQFRAAPPPSGAADGKTVEAPFSPEKYSPRAKMYLRAELQLIHGSVLLQEPRRADFADYLDHLDDLLAHCSDGKCKVWLLLIPHCAQVGARYMQRMEALGAKFPDPQGMQAVDYPFLDLMATHLSPQSHVQVVNALPVLRELEVEGTPAYYNNDIHLSPAGQSALAKLMAGHLPTP